MKFLSYKHQGKVSYGAVVDDGVVDLGKRFAKKYPTLRAALADAAWLTGLPVPHELEN